MIKLAPSRSRTELASSLGSQSVAVVPLAA